MTDRVTQHDYIVVLTVREHFTMVVSASSAREAREKALLYGRGDDDVALVTQNGDREIIGARAYRDD